MCRLLLIQFLACNEGYFGTNCSRVCSPNCQHGHCRHTNGSCTSCVKGWMGRNCTTGNFAHNFLLNRCKECKGKRFHLKKKQRKNLLKANKKINEAKK